MENKDLYQIHYNHEILSIPKGTPHISQVGFINPFETTRLIHLKKKVNIQYAFIKIMK